MTRRPALRSERPREPVSTSIPGRGGYVVFAGTGKTSAGCFGKKAAANVIERYQLQERLIESLRRSPEFARLVPRVAECHRSFRHKVCDHRHEWAEAQNSCNVRLCPHDQRKRSLRLAARWESVLADRDGLRYCVLAERNSSDLGEGMASLYRAWNRLRKMPLWKSATRGAVAVLEVTFNREDATWHPHLNVLFEGAYIPFEALKHAWIAATNGHGQTAFIRAADSGTIRELLKYVTKLNDFVDDPEIVSMFLSATARRRFVRTYGTFYRLPVDDEECTGTCPDCGSTTIADVGVLHPEQVALDRAGVMRVTLSRLRPSQQPSTEDFDVTWPRAPVEPSQSEQSWREFTRRYEQREQARQVAIDTSQQEHTPPCGN